MHYIAGLQHTMSESDSNNMAGSSEKGSSVDIAQRIRSTRARVGLTRKQLAVASNASERYLATLETGAGNPSIDMLEAIADALNVAPAELLPMGGERDPLIARIAMQLRRMPNDRVREVLAYIGKPSESLGDKASRISLIGLRGAGKSTLGAALAERLGYPFFEISKEVERIYGGSIAVMMELNGPATLRKFEAQVLDEIIGKNEAAVIAAPGAIVSSPALYEQLLRSSKSIWLQASPEDHMQRVMAQGDLRPMAGNRTAMNDLKAILAARESEYARADVRLDTSAQDFTATLNLLIECALAI
jgi:XRE family transcriptional regulator, aerobic/anaerobic benzoate catabolism transcriptional regulator